MGADLAGRSVLVVGASAGIGRAIALRAAAIGGDVVFCGRREDRLQEAIQLAGSGHSVVADISDPPQCDALVAAAVEAVGGLDLVVLAASGSGMALLTDTGEEIWRRILYTNIVGPSLIVRAALPHLSPGAVVAFLSSGSVRFPLAGVVPYTVSKAGMEDLVRGWRIEQPHFRFTNIAVGPTDGTDFARDIDPVIGTELLPFHVGLGRMWAKNMHADELGPLIADSLALALASPGVDCQDYTFRPPGLPYIGDVASFLEVRGAGDYASFTEGWATGGPAGKPPASGA
jgi:NAD(P)-dependent dehydrogenase (short-subunit alcohol dehydrogenase family)